MMLESGCAIKLQPPSLQYKPTSLHVEKGNISPEKRTDFQAEHFNRPFYPPDSTLCHLAKITNPKSEKVLPNGQMTDPPDGWKFFMTGENEEDGYFGAAFWHQDNQHLVISHRGTKNWNGILTDVKGVILKKYASQVHSACTFAFLVLKELGKKLGNECCYFSISITGHSLGGWLAQITTFAIEYLTVAGDELYLRYLNKGERKYHPHTVTFDNPGCYDMLTKLTDDYFHRYENDLISPLDMTSYFIAPNHFNCKNRHAGLLLRFCFEIKDSGGKGIWYWLDPHTAKYHELNNFLDVFNSSDEILIYRMYDWPVFSVRESLKDMPTKFINKLTDSVSSTVNKLTDSVSSSVNKLTGFVSSSVNKCTDFVLSSFGAERSSPEAETSSPEAENSSQMDKLKLSDSFIDQFKQPVKDEYSVVISLVNEKNNFHIHAVVLDLLNMEYTAVHYKSETYDKQSRKTNIFKDDEFIFVENCKAIQEHGINPSKMKKFFQDKKLGEFSEFLQDFKILENNIKSENIERIVNRTKWLFLIFPEMVHVMKKQISENPKLYEAAYRITMNSYIRSLPKYGFSYQDNIGLEDFLGSDSVQMMVLKAKETPDEASRVYYLLEESNLKNNYCLFSVDDIEYLSKYVDVYEVFASPTCTIDKIFVIDFKDSKNSDIPYELHKKISEKNKKKIICIVPEETDLSETKLKSSNIKIVTGNVGFKDLSDSKQEQILQREVISINSKKYTLRDFVKEKDLDTLSFELIKGITQNQITKFNLESDHFNHVFLSLSCLKLSKKIINFKALEDFMKNYESTLEKNFSDVKFFVTGVEDKTLFPFIPEDQIILDLTMNEDRFYEECLSNMGKTIFKLHVENQEEKEIRWLEVFDAGLYIQREFHTEIKLDNQLLDFLQEEKKINSDYIFVLENDSNPLNDKLARLLKDGKIKTVTTLTEGNSAFTSKSEDQTRYLIRLNDKNQFFLENYQGSLQEIRKFARNNENKSITEDELLEKNEKIMLITNEPGMGKSTTLLKIAKKNIAKGWVFWINLINAHEFVDCSSSINLDDAITFLSNFSRNSSKLVKTLLEYCLKNKGSVPVYIFFDGFDEIQDWSNKTKSMIQEKIVQMIKFLIETSAKIWVTSRTYDCQILENELNILSVNLKEVNEEEQSDFLKKFWILGTSLDCDNNQNKNELGNYATKIIRKLNNVINIKTRSFMGIPLQLRMIGEVFQPKSWPIDFPDDLNLNLHDLYERFIERKYEIYSDEKHLNFIPRDLVKWLLSSFNKAHGTIGIKFLFKNFFKDLPQIDREKFSVINRIGLVQINGESVQFIHRTFAEYFSAQKLITLLKNNPDQYIQGFAMNILSAPGYKVIRRFMNDYLLSKCCPVINLTFVPNNWKSCAYWEYKCPYEEIDNIKKKLRSVEDFQIYYESRRRIHPNDLEPLDDVIKKSNYGKQKLNSEESCANGEDKCHYEERKNEHVRKDGRVLLEHQFELYYSWEDECHYEEVKNEYARKDETVLSVKDFYDYYKNRSGDLETPEQVIHKLNCRKHYILHNLVIENNDKLMEMILECFKNESEDLLAKFINARRKGETVLHVAMKYHFKKIASILLDYKININDRDKYNKTALDSAFGNQDFLIIMIEKNPEIVNEKFLLALLCRSINNNQVGDALKLLESGAISDSSLIEAFSCYDDEEISSITRCGIRLYIFLLLFKFRKPLFSKDDGESSIKYLLDKMKYNDRISDFILELVDKEKEFEENFFFRENLLFFALVQNCVNVAKRLLENGTNPNATDSLLRTPMHLAAENDNLDVIKLLLDKRFKTEINVLGCYGKSHLYLAAEKGHWEQVLYFLDLDKNIYRTGNSGILNLAKTDNWIENKWTEIEEKLKKLIVKPEGNDYVDVRTKNNWNSISKLLLELKGIFYVLNNRTGTLFHVACKYNNLEAAKKLIEMGVKINVDDMKGRTGLFLAAEENKWDFVLELLKHLKGRRNVFYKNIETDRKILHLAVEKNLKGIVRKLIETDLDANALDSDGRTASFLAAEKKNWDMVFTLLESEKVNPNATFNGQTLLHLSISNNELDKTLKLIDERNADVNVIDNYGNTPLLLAAHESLWELVHDLLKRKADPKVANNENETVLHIACRDNKRDIAVELIREHRCNVNAEDIFGRTPLYIAAENGNWELALKLIDEGGNAAHKENLLLSLAADAGQNLLRLKLLEESSQMRPL